MNAPWVKSAIGVKPVNSHYKSLATMNRQELIDAIAAQTQSSKVATARFVDTFTATVQETVLNGEKVKLAGFGTFERISAAARLGRNPKTGQQYPIEASARPRFIPSEVFKDKARASTDAGVA